MTKITIGCDPELFVKNDKGVIVSCEEFLPGTKDEPFKVKHGAIQVDGISAEFNIDPVESEDEFIHNIREVLKQLRTMLPAGYKLLATPDVGLPITKFNALPPKSKELGCDPDFQVNRLLVRQRPPWKRYFDASGKPFFCGSGHIHVGWTSGESVTDEQHLADCKTIVNYLDFGVSNFLVNFDSGYVRPGWYGQKGVFRPKPYGVEYRTPSNVWLRNENLARTVYRQTMTSVEMAMEGGHPGTYPDYYVLVHNRTMAKTIYGKQIKDKTGWFRRGDIPACKQASPEVNL